MFVNYLRGRIDEEHLKMVLCYLMLFIARNSELISIELFGFDKEQNKSQSSDLYPFRLH